MAAEIKDGVTVLGLLERGNVTVDLTNELEIVLKHLGEIAAQRGKSKGSLTLKLSIGIENGAVHVDADFSTKLPKMPRPSTLFFLTANGGLSLDHPNQISMFPREVDREAVKAAGEV